MSTIIIIKGIKYMSKYKNIVIGAVVVLAVGYWGYMVFKSPTVSSVEQKEPIKIGVVLPLTGDLSSMGEPAKNAVELSLEEINNAGGINGRKLVAIFENGKCDGAASISAVQKLINVDKVSAIIGEICSGATIAMAPIVEKNKIPLISPCSSSPDITNAGDYIFRVYPSDSLQGKYMAEYVKNILKQSRVAILYINNDWGNGVAQVFEKTFVDIGGIIVLRDSYLQGSNDIKTQLTKIKSVNPEAIIWPGYTDDTIAGLKQLRSLSIKSDIVGGDSWSDPKIVEEALSNAEGIKWMEVKSPVAPEFMQKFMEAKRGKKEVPVCSLQSYDIVKVLGNAFKNVNSIDGELVKNELYKTDIDGLSGHITFDKNGDLKDANFGVRTIKDGKAVEVK